MEDGEGGEDESMQEEAEEGRRPLFRKSENQPSSQEVQEHMKTHIPCHSWCAHCVSWSLYPQVKHPHVALSTEVLLFLTKALSSPK